MSRGSIGRAVLILGLAAPWAPGQAAPAFHASGLVKPGDAAKYGSYSIIKIGDGVYQIAGRGDPKAKAGGLIGADMYLIRGASRS